MPHSQAVGATIGTWTLGCTALSVLAPDNGTHTIQITPYFPGHDCTFDHEIVFPLQDIADNMGPKLVLSLIASEASSSSAINAPVSIS